MGSYVLQPERVMGLPIYRFTGPTCGGSAIALLYFNDVTQQWVVGPRVGAPPFVLMADGSATDYQPYNVTATWQVTMHDGRRAPQPWIRVVCLKSFGHGTTILRQPAPCAAQTEVHAIIRVEVWHKSRVHDRQIGWVELPRSMVQLGAAPVFLALRLRPRYHGVVRCTFLRTRKPRTRPPNMPVPPRFRPLPPRARDGAALAAALARLGVAPTEDVEVELVHMFRAGGYAMDCIAVAERSEREEWEGLGGQTAAGPPRLYSTAVHLYLNKVRPPEQELGRLCSVEEIWTGGSVTARVDSACEPGGNDAARGAAPSAKLEANMEAHAAAGAGCKGDAVRAYVRMRVQKPVRARLQAQMRTQQMRAWALLSQGATRTYLEVLQQADTPAHTAIVASLVPGSGTCADGFSLPDGPVLFAGGLSVLRALYHEKLVGKKGALESRIAAIPRLPQRVMGRF
eukprot:g5955.t1